MLKDLHDLLKVEDIPATVDNTTPCSTMNLATNSVGSCRSFTDSVDSTGAMKLAEKLSRGDESFEGSLQPQTCGTATECFANCLINAEHCNTLRLNIDTFDGVRWATIFRIVHDLSPNEGGPLHIVFLSFSERLDCRFRILHHLLDDKTCSKKEFGVLVNERIAQMDNLEFVICRGVFPGNEQQEHLLRAAAVGSFVRCAIFSGRFRALGCLLWIRKGRVSTCGNCREEMRKIGRSSNVTNSLRTNFRFLRNKRCVVFSVFSVCRCLLQCM